MSFPAMPPLGPPNLANGDSGPGGQNDYAPWVQMRPYLRNLLVAAYDVRFYGATGDGVTNDQPAIQLALDLCRLNGGGSLGNIPGGATKADLQVTHSNGTRIKIDYSISFWMDQSNTIPDGDIGTQALYNAANPSVNPYF